MTTDERQKLIAAITASPTYKLAQEDTAFLTSESARAARLALESMRPEQYLHRLQINSTVVVFGSARIIPPDQARERLDTLRASLPAAPAPADSARLRDAERHLKYSRYYEEARVLAQKLSKTCQSDFGRELVVVTGGGPGIMEAANRGAHDADACSMGLNIELPHEQIPNPYITPELAFRFHYFAMRKMHFMLRARALVAFPGGFGTLDELFEALTLVQTGKMKPIPIVLVGREFWQSAIDLEFLVAEGFIDPNERALAQIVETGAEAAEWVLKHHTTTPALKS